MKLQNPSIHVFLTWFTVIRSSGDSPTKSTPFLQLTAKGYREGRGFGLPSHDILFAENGGLICSFFWHDLFISRYLRPDERANRWISVVYFDPESHRLASHSYHLICPTNERNCFRGEARLLLVVVVVLAASRTTGGGGWPADWRFLDLLLIWNFITMLSKPQWMEFNRVF